MTRRRDANGQASPFSQADCRILILAFSWPGSSRPFSFAKRSRDPLRRHGRTCSGHPRLWLLHKRRKTWMAGPSRGACHRAAHSRGPVGASPGHDELRMRAAFIPIKFSNSHVSSFSRREGPRELSPDFVWSALFGAVFLALLAERFLISPLKQRERSAIRRGVETVLIKHGDRPRPLPRAASP